ncbi:unnamed protein product [Leptidea sinapis]|uniref:Uncharacterized protein n=1 Tax=Leptidea sinapis TaxID=189913 RepID=A0A5E4QUK6_9NEOP|nr:unnamed protein product [Leptidea sinapis]
MNDKMSEMEEKVVMTPKSKTATSTTLIVERKAVVAEPSDKIHVAGGDHTGIIINKEKNLENGVTEQCHAQLEFCVYLVSAVDGSHTREARALRFWFKPTVPLQDCPHEAQAFFRELVSPQNFPKDYVGFIKKIIKLMQNKYHELKVLEVELRQEGHATPPPEFSDEENQANQTYLSEQRVVGRWSKAEVKDALESLEEKGLTRTMSEGLYIRQHSVDTQLW